MYLYAAEYYEKNGNLNVPKRYKTVLEYSLGTWIMTQRRVYNGTANGILTQDRIDSLNKIGMVRKNKSDISWEKNFLTAKSYYEK